MIGRKITAKLAVGAVAVGVLLLAGLGVMGWQLLNAHRDLGTSETQLAQCRADNEHQTEQIAELGADLNALTESIAIERAAFETARLEAERRARARERELATERSARQVIYDTHPDCDLWARTAVCPEIAERQVERRRALIERWEGGEDE